MLAEAIFYLSIAELANRSAALKAARLGVGHVKLSHDTGNNEATNHVIGEQEEEAVAQCDERCSLPRPPKQDYAELNGGDISKSSLESWPAVHI